MKQNFFSIICCGYNSVEWIDNCILSILGQSYQNFEIICVDANTNDGTFEKLTQYSAQYPEKIKLFKNEGRTWR